MVKNSILDGVVSRPSRMPRTERRRLRRDLKVKPRIELLEVKLVLSAFTWTGAGGDELWSNSDNWDVGGGLVPDTGDNLIFPSVEGTKTLNNDLSIGGALSGIEFTDSTYVLQGNAITTENLVDNSTGGVNQIDLKVTIAGTGSQTVNTLQGSTLKLTQALALTAGGTLGSDGSSAPLILVGGLEGAGNVSVTGSDATIIYGTPYAGGSFSVTGSGVLIQITPCVTSYDGNIKSCVGTATTGEGDDTGNLDLTGTEHLDAGIYNDTWFYYGTAATTESVTNVINKAALTVSITGDPTKEFDGTQTATLGPANYSVAGLISGESITVTQTSGLYGSASAGSQTVSADLTESSFTAGGGTDLSNYILPTSATGAGTITPKILTATIIASSKTYDGTTLASLSSQDLSGVIGTDDVSLVVSSSDFDTKDVGTGKTVTATGLSLSGADAANYSLNGVTTATSTADITPKALTVIDLLGIDKEYDGTTTATVDDTSASMVGVVGADSVGVDPSGAAINFDTPDAGLDKLVTVTGLVLTGADAGNYTLDNPTTTADITPKAVSPSIAANSKIYDGTTTATLSTQALIGVIGADDVSLQAAASDFDTKDVGVGKTVTATGLSLAGAAAGNYSLDGVTTATSTADITPKVVTPIIVASNKVYDGTTTASLSEQDISGVAGADDVALSVTDSLFDTKDVGIGKTVTTNGLSLVGADAGNYSLDGVTTATSTADITPKALTVVGIVGTDKEYDGTTTSSADWSSASVVGIVGSDSVAADPTGSIANFDTPDAGLDKLVTVTGAVLTGADAGNYTLDNPATTADITPKAVSPSIAANSKIYDGTTAATLSTQALIGVIGADDVSLQAAASDFDTKDVGVGKTVTATGLSLSGAAAGNYSLDGVTTATSTADITPKVVSPNIVANSKVYDGTTTASLSSQSVSGVIGGEDVTLLVTGSDFDTKNVGAGKTVTATGLSIAGLDVGNYTLDGETTATALADITARSLDPIISANDKVYDGTTTATLASQGVVGIIGSDDVALGIGSASFGTKDAGIGKTVTAAELSLSGLDAGNYALSSPTATATATISPALLTVTADDKSRVFGQANPDFTASYSGFVAGESLGDSGVTGNPLMSTTATQTSDAGSYPIVIEEGSLAANNYTFSLVNGSLTITPGSLATSTSVFALTSAPVTGQWVSFSAQVSPVSSSIPPTGSVVFYDGSQVIGAGSLDGGIATFSTNQLSLGSHQIWASYAGDGTSLPSQSSQVAVSVSSAFTATTLVVTPASTGRGFILDARVIPVTPGGGTPTGTITFMVNRRGFRTVSLVNGEAQWFVSSRSAVRRWFTAAYRANSGAYTNSISNTVFVGRPPARTVGPRVQTAIPLISAAVRADAGAHSWAAGALTTNTEASGPLAAIRRWFGSKRST